MSDRYVLVGNPLGHSKSPRIHGDFAQATGEDVAYGLLEAPLDGFRGAVDVFRAAGGRGLNVTLPFKLEAFAYATQLMDRARLAGAVNCMKFEGDAILAENFDGLGLVNDIQRNLGFAMAGKRVLLLGAGGAARGALLPFLETKPALLFVANRTVSKALALGEQFGEWGPIRAGGYADIEGAWDVVVNATSASLRGELPPVPARAFAGGCLAYDLVYGKGLTPFLRVAREAGAGHVADGVGMLVEQAAEAWVWWRGIRPQTQPVIASLTVPLE
jgi:shikimate dehydrogenase